MIRKLEPATDQTGQRGARRRMTPERLAYIRAGYAKGLRDEAILPGVNALPGPAVKSAGALKLHANLNGIQRGRPPRKDDEATLRARRDRSNELRRNRRAAVAAKKPKPEEHAPRMARRTSASPAPSHAPAEETPRVQASPEIADAVTARRYDGARMALGRRAKPEEVARNHNLPLREVYRIAMDLRREGAAA